MRPSVHRTTEPPELFITVSTPWAIRNYFNTGVVRELARRTRVTALTTEHLAACLNRDGHSSYVRVATWESGEEPLRWRLGRQLRKKLYMETRRVHTERIWSRYSRRPLYQRLSAPLVSAAARILDANRSLRIVSDLDRAINRSDVFQDLFRRSDSALLFATHADTYFEESVLRSANAAGIPSVLMVLSWDHLSTKVVLSDRYERLLVWTPSQRDEVLSNYPWYEPGQVRVVGIPHYDQYYDPTPTTRAAWCGRYGLDPAKRTLVFFSMPQSRHDSQHLIVENLAAEIERAGDLPSDLQILVKCHPFDDPACYAPVIERYSNVRMFTTAKRSNRSATDWLPDPEEIENARDCFVFADATCNIYSTVTIEAALFDKPIIHIAFDAAPLRPGRVPCREYYNFTHFKPIVDMEASTLVYNQQELQHALREALDYPGARSAQRRALARRFAGPMDGQSSMRVVRELLDVLSIPEAPQAAAQKEQVIA